MVDVHVEDGKKSEWVALDTICLDGSAYSWLCKNKICEVVSVKKLSIPLE